MCRYRFSDFDNCATLVGDVDNGRGWARVDREGYVGNVGTFCSIVL